MGAMKIRARVVGLGVAPGGVRVRVRVRLRSLWSPIDSFVGPVELVVVWTPKDAVRLEERVIEQHGQFLLDLAAAKTGRAVAWHVQLSGWAPR